ncbi:hypothetical protein [Holdemanella porci]|uniref:hypothetical protein n=1 Tax=Holdemanella porci TaxID=2652276 RepID=UPI003AB8DF23
MNFEKKKFYEMTKRKDYRDAQNLIKELTIQINSLDEFKESKELIQELRKQRKEQYDIIYNIKKMFDWSEFGFTNDMKKYRKYYKANLNSTICDNLSGRCFKAFEKMESELIKDQYRNDEDKVNPCVHYKRKDSLRCLTAKKNSTGIRFSLDEGNRIGTVKWQGLVFSIDLSKCTLYEWQALQSEICYCAVKREKIKGKWKYYIQITLKGHVPDKFDKQTGELKRQLGKGNVGLYFTSTSLTVSTENGVKTYPLEIKNNEDKKTELLQKMDTSRRATNPDNYNEDGTSKEKSEIKGWHFSKAYKKYRAELYEIYRKECEEKKLLQEILANEVIASGDVFNCNKMDFKFLQRNLGKKIQSASPAMLKTTIERKLSYHDVSINEISYSKLNPIFEEKNVSKKDLEEVAALIRQF